jgi:hypothetical protein
MKRSNIVALNNSIVGNRQKQAASLLSQSATALLISTFEFLVRNNISREFIIDKTHSFFHQTSKTTKSLRLYRDMLRRHEAMGVVMSTWYSDPRFLDASGRPISLHPKDGHKSLPRLLSASGISLSSAIALKLMRRSPSVRIGADGFLTAVRRVFVLPDLELPRAAFVVENYLGTLQKNALGRKNKSVLLLERSCHVSNVDISLVAPLLRDIEGRGTAFIDSIDGDLEGRRLRQTQAKNSCELGVSVFAWTKLKQTKRRTKKISRQGRSPLVGNPFSQTISD